MKQQQETNRQRIMWTILSLLSYGHYPCTISYLLYNFIFNQKKKINFLKTKYIIRKHGKSVKVAKWVHQIEIPAHDTNINY